MGDLFSMDCEVATPVRVGIGFSYDEIREKCQKVIKAERAREERLRLSDIDSSGHIFNVDNQQPRKLPRKSMKRKSRSRRSKYQGSDDAEVLRQKMSAIGSGGRIKGRREIVNNNVCIDTVSWERL